MADRPMNEEAYGQTVDFAAVQSPDAAEHRDVE